MAQSDFAKKIEIDGLEIEYTDVMTGDKNRNRFLVCFIYDKRKKT